MGSKKFSIIKRMIAELKNLSAERKLLKKIDVGFDNHEFKMYLQPIVDNKTKEIVSFEALSRWEPIGGEVIPPVKYIGVMERHGISAKLDYFMFEAVCKKLCAWKDTELADLSISCNFSKSTISQKFFVANIKNIADKYLFDKNKIIMEITEDTMEKDLEGSIHNIQKVKELGFRIALDDIGSGYTSLMSLGDYPVDVVKIDRSILVNTGKANGKKLFLGIVSLAHYLNLKVVCEGVETEEQNQFVTESKCDYIQGWYYSKALPEKQIEDFTKQYMKNLEKVNIVEETCITID